MPASMMPKADRERTANPRAGTALAPCSGVPREHVPSVSEILGNVTGMVTRVKCDVLNYRLDIAVKHSPFQPLMLGVNAAV
jgi:hypothetical protein